MAVELVLQDGVEVAPGHEVTLDLAVTNTGVVVDQMQLSVLGDAAPWASVNPPSIALFPGDTAHATVRLAPPAEGGPPAGPMALGILARSAETNETVVAEAVVSVISAVALDVQLVPVTSYGRNRAAHTLVVRNLGNLTVPVMVAATDPDQLLELQLAPSSAEVGPGAEATFTVRLRSVAARDAPRVSFTVTATAPGTDEVSVVGTFVHRRRRALLPLALAAAALLIVAVLALRQNEDSKALPASPIGGSGSESTTTLVGLGQPPPGPGASTAGPGGGGGPAGGGGPGGGAPSGGAGAQPGPGGGATGSAGRTGPTVGPGQPPTPTTQPRPGTPPPTNPQPPVGPCSGDNLIAQTGSFEAGLTGWTITSGRPGTATYGSGYPSPPVDYLGSTYAVGNTDGATIEQVASLGPCQAGIAAGGKVINTGGWMGRYNGRNETVVLTVFFRAAGRDIGGCPAFAAPGAADPGGATAMIEAGAPTCPIPPSANEVGLRVTFAAGAGGYDNAYLYVG